MQPPTKTPTAASASVKPPESGKTRVNLGRLDGSAKLPPKGEYSVKFSRRPKK